MGRGWNRNIAASDPTAHAEVMALREAGAAVGNHRLEACDLFVTIEPCAMCSGALVHARIRRLVYGADDPKAGAVHSVMQVLNHPKLNHKWKFAAECWPGGARKCCNRSLRVDVSGGSDPLES